MGFLVLRKRRKIMSISTMTYQVKGEFQLESGRSIHDLQLSYTTLGTLSPSKDNVIWIFHAMTANSNPTEWWPGMVGQGKFFDPNNYFIICVNMPGSCYGSTGPLDIDPVTGKPYHKSFPFFTSLDMARSFQALKNHLGIEKIYLGIGGSMGGQQLLSWACMEPELFDYIVPIATNAFHSPWGKAFNASQRMCIEADPTWKEDHPDAGKEGMKVARSIALISYRHYETYWSTQQDDKSTLDHYKSESYQRYQGEKLAKRFNAYSYYVLSKSMDSHHLGRGVESAEKMLANIKSNSLTIGISSDILFPVKEQEFIAAHIKKGSLEIIDSNYGHDGFLLEDEKITMLLKKLTT